MHHAEQHRQGHGYEAAQVGDVIGQEGQDTPQDRVIDPERQQHRGGEYPRQQTDEGHDRQVLRDRGVDPLHHGQDLCRPLVLEAGPDARREVGRF